MRGQAKGLVSENKARAAIESVAVLSQFSLRQFAGGH